MRRLTPMEDAIIRIVSERHWPGFRTDSLEVTRREHTGVGRYTHLVDHAEQSIEDGSYGAGDHFVEMDGVPNGLFFTVEAENGRISYLEIASCGSDSWDGEERSWRIS
jgi:hypothetical protein